MMEQNGKGAVSLRLFPANLDKWQTTDVCLIEKIMLSESQSTSPFLHELIEKVAMKYQCPLMALVPVVGDVNHEIASALVAFGFTKLPMEYSNENIFCNVFIHGEIDMASCATVLESLG